MKSQISFVCQECGYDSPQWLGKCPECGNWNTFREIKVQTSNLKSQTTSLTPEKIEPKKLSEIKFESKE